MFQIQTMLLHALSAAASSRADRAYADACRLWECYSAAGFGDAHPALGCERDATHWYAAALRLFEAACVAEALAEEPPFRAA